ncbi:hypothetical protein DFJ74DRAFT_707684 [Hyaloraphidium curvatum]|nr:hypothetical protein DFJ74DRAFT_707684 [Hyaloraphidium curvatum]
MAHSKAPGVAGDDISAKNTSFEPLQQVCACLNAFHVYAGVEYMVSERIFDTLDADEKKMWHSHVAEVKSGMPVMPKPALVPDAVWEAAENAEMEQVVRWFGKTYHFWQTDLGHTLPLGPPKLMKSYVPEAGMPCEAWDARDRRMGIDRERKKAGREGFKEPGRKEGADGCWEGRGGSRLPRIAGLAALLGALLLCLSPASANNNGVVCRTLRQNGGGRCTTTRCKSTSTRWATRTATRKTTVTQKVTSTSTQKTSTTTTASIWVFPLPDGGPTITVTPTQLPFPDTTYTFVTTSTVFVSGSTFTVTESGNIELPIVTRTTTLTITSTRTTTTGFVLDCESAPALDDSLRRPFRRRRRLLRRAPRGIRGQAPLELPTGEHVNATFRPIGMDGPGLLWGGMAVAAISDGGTEDFGGHPAGFFAPPHLEPRQIVPNTNNGNKPCVVRCTSYKRCTVRRTKTRTTTQKSTKKVTSTKRTTQTVVVTSTIRTTGVASATTSGGVATITLTIPGLIPDVTGTYLFSTTTETFTVPNDATTTVISSPGPAATITSTLVAPTTPTVTTSVVATITCGPDPGPAPPPPIIVTTTTEATRTNPVQTRTTSGTTSGTTSASQTATSSTLSETSSETTVCCADVDADHVLLHRNFNVRDRDDPDLLHEQPDHRVEHLVHVLHANALFDDIENHQQPLPDDELDQPDRNHVLAVADVDFAHFFDDQRVPNLEHVDHDRNSDDIDLHDYELHIADERDADVQHSERDDLGITDHFESVRYDFIDHRNAFEHVRDDVIGDAHELILDLAHGDVIEPHGHHELPLSDLLVAHADLTRTSSSLTQTTSSRTRSSTTSYTSTLSLLCVESPPVKPPVGGSDPWSGSLEAEAPITPPGVTFQSNTGGDGWDLGFHEDGERIFNIFHHKTPWTLDCHIKWNGARCAGGYPFKAPSTVASVFQPHTFFSPLNPNLIISWVGLSEPEGQSSSGIMAIDVGAKGATPKILGTYKMTRPGFGSRPTGFGGDYGPTGGVVTGNLFWAVNNAQNAGLDAERNAMLCFDVAAGQECPGSPYPIAYPAGWKNAAAVTAWLMLAGGKFYVFNPGTIGSTRSNVVTCFDPRAADYRCAGTAWPQIAPANTSSDGSSRASDLFPYVPRGTPEGVCVGGVSQENRTNTGNAYCWTLAGAPIGFLRGLKTAGLKWSGTSGALFQSTKLLLPSASGVQCFDMATGATCPGYPIAGLAPANETTNGWYRTYTIRQETPTCYWANGDAGNIWNFNPVTRTRGCGSQPTAFDNFAPIELTDPAKCTQNITAWETFTLVSVEGAYAAANITFFDKGGAAVPGLTNVALSRPPASVSLASLSPAATGNNLRFEIKFSGLQCQVCKFRYRVTFKSTPQICCNANIVVPGSF